MVDTLERTYLYTKRDVYYFSKHVPVDLRAHHKRNRLVICLRTKNYNHAYRLSRMHQERLEGYWLTLRMQQTDFMLASPAIQQISTGHIPSGHGPSLMEAQATYIHLKGDGKSKTFFRAAERNVGYVIKALGNRSLGDYTSKDAATFRDYLFDKGLASASVRRVFSSLRAIVNITIQEQGLNITNAFARTFIPEKNDLIDRKPIPIDDIKKVQSLCMDQDDNLRHMIALISDTGMRLSEAAGLVRSDLCLDGDEPYIDLRPHPWRSLKTSDSTRKIPLVGASLWAVKQLSTQEAFLFPQYNKTDQTNANSASAALNKWLKPHVPDGCVMHSFRHSLRDRLRAVECPSDVVNQIGGWHTAGVGEGYGEGYPIKVLRNWLAKA